MLWRKNIYYTQIYKNDIPKHDNSLLNKLYFPSSVLIHLSDDDISQIKGRLRMDIWLHYYDVTCPVQ